MSFNFERGVYETGIEFDQFMHFAERQVGQNWCWAACVEMVLHYYGIRITQYDIVERTFGTDPDGNLPDWGASPSVVHENLNNWGVDNEGLPYKIRARYFPKVPSPVDFLNQLIRRKPIIVGYNHHGSGHAVVVTGACFKINRNNFVSVKSIIVQDPSGESVEYTAGSLTKLIYSAWFIDVQLDL
ncbi:MAG: C39 family peptidase [Flavobacteriales bacterium]|nr:C39 family peptidase [Flavobacteriales bacterium]